MRGFVVRCSGLRVSGFRGFGLGFRVVRLGFDVIGVACLGFGVSRYGVLEVRGFGIHDFQGTCFEVRVFGVRGFAFGVGVIGVVRSGFGVFGVRCFMFRGFEVLG